MCFFFEFAKKIEFSEFEFKFKFTGLDVSVSEDSDLTSPSQKHIIWIVSGCVFGVILISLLVYLTWNCGPRDGKCSYMSHFGIFETSGKS